MPKARVRRLHPIRGAAALILGLMLVFWPATHSHADRGKTDLATTTGWRLVKEVEGYLRDRDVPAFRNHVESRFGEKTIGILMKSDDVDCRRAAAIALGTVGTFESNTQVGEALKDRDAVVRSLASNALWAIWFRADTAENNDRLLVVADLIRRERLREAEVEATRLIEHSPKFAEAYNQRAIARFSLGHFEESAEDCKQVMALNPYHFGANSGLGQCQLRAGKVAEAVETFRVGLKIQPFNEALKQMIEALDAGD